MNILIIGNGFDIAHGLPTTYTDFLKFINQILRVKRCYCSVREFESKNERTGYDKFNELNKEVKKYIHSKIVNDEEPDAYVKDTYELKNDKIVKEIIDLAENNVWFKWFEQSSTYKTKNWVDFEDEISKVVQNIDTTSKKNINLLPEDIKKIFFPLKDYGTERFDITTCRDKMLQDLNRLIRCLEIYLEDCVRNIDKSLLSMDIYNLPIDKIISFNYTDTYNRLYTCKHRNVEYDYIHGKSKINGDNPNNMVLGIDEYLSVEEQYSNIDYIEFKKYFQRIHKATGCTYKKWLEEIDKSKDNNHKAYFFGHSLSKTDKDVLVEILKNDKITSTIFYKDKDHYAQLITNLVQVIGQSELISRVYGTDPKIKFQEQKEMMDRNNSDWQILNDCDSLWNLHKLHNDEISLLIKNMKSRIDDQDFNYFHSQRNVISLYDAWINNVDWDIMNRELLIDITKELYSPETYEIFDTQEWDNIDYYGIVPCDERVAEFITDINKYNYSKKYKDSFKFNDLNYLYKQIEEYFTDDIDDIKDIKGIELLNSLLLMFENCNINIGLIWKCIYLLIKKISSDTIRTFIDEKILHTKGVERLRYQHIKDIMEESGYYEYIEEQVKEPIV